MTPRPSTLTPHDRVIRQQLEAGQTYESIAKGLGVAVTTLKSYSARQNMPKPAVQAKAVKVTAPKPAPGSQVSREEILESELRELKASLTKARKADVAQERIIEAVEHALATVAPPTEQWYYPSTPASDEAPKHRAALLLSDFHGGEVVAREAVNGLNSYDWDTMEERVDEVISATLSHLRHSPAVTGLDVAFIGDMCSGSNHLELAVSNEYPLAEQAVRMGHLEASIIERLAPHVPDVRVISVVGNHPRFQMKPAAKNIHDNGDWIASIIAKAQVERSCDNVTFDVPLSGATFWTIAGLTYYVSHGDGVRSSMPGVPWGGLTRRLNEIRRAHAGQKLDGWWCGHFHQANAMLDLGVFMNGSLKGADEWCLKNFGGGSPPCQLLLMFNEAKSRLTDVKLITPRAGL